MDDFLKEIKSNNEQFSQEYMDMMKQYYQKMTKANVEGKGQATGVPDEEGGMVIVPEPEFCLKIIDSNEQKVFVNITSHDKIDAPKEEHILEMQNQLGVRLPLSLSDKVEDFDAKGNICQVYDVILNPNVVKKAEKDPTIFKFMVQLVWERIRQRFNHELSTNFSRMKNMKYKGKTIRPQRVRVRTGPRIEEVFNKETENRERSAYSTKEISKEVTEKGKTPTWNFIILKDFSDKILKKIARENKGYIERKFDEESLRHNKVTENEFLFYDGTNASPKHGLGLLFIADLGIVSKSFGISLNVADEGFVLSCGKIYSLEISLPYRVDSGRAQSFFDAEAEYGRCLYIWLPFYEEDFKGMSGAIGKEAKFARVENISEDYLYDLVV